MRSHLLRIILATLALVVGAVQADAQSPTKVKIRLDWKGGAQHAPFYLGKQNGYYRDEGLDLDVISGSGSSDTIKQIGSKKPWSSAWSTRWCWCKARSSACRQSRSRAKSRGSRPATDPPGAGDPGMLTTLCHYRSCMVRDQRGRRSVCDARAP
jgi:hypothetical protein